MLTLILNLAIPFSNYLQKAKKKVSYHCIMSFEIITKIDKSDNVAVANLAIMKGDIIPLEHKTITAKAEIPHGSSIALEDIKEGEYIVKFGFKVGVATKDILQGENLCSYNYSTTLTDVEKLCATLAQKHREYISQKEKEVRDYSLRIGTYKTNNKTGLKKSVAVISNTVNEGLAKTLDQDAIIVETKEDAEQYLMHPNLAGALILGFNLANSDIICSMENPTSDVEQQLLEIKEKVKALKKTSSPLSELVLEIHGCSQNSIHNHIIGNLVDDLICLGVSVIIDITIPLPITLQLIKEKLVDKSMISLIPDQKGESKVDKELDCLQVMGKADISAIIDNTHHYKKGLNINFSTKHTQSHIVLDLTGSLTSTPLSPVLYFNAVGDCKEMTVESLLFDINKIISKNS